MCLNQFSSFSSLLLWKVSVTDIALGVRIWGIITSISPSMIFRMLLDLAFLDGNLGRHCYLTCEHSHMIHLNVIVHLWKKISFPKGYFHSLVSMLFVISVRLKWCTLFRICCSLCVLQGLKNTGRQSFSRALNSRKNTN